MTAMQGGVARRVVAVTSPSERGARARRLSVWGLSGFVLSGLVVSGCGSRSGLLGDSEPELEQRPLTLEEAAMERVAVASPPRLVDEPAPEPVLSGCVDITRSYSSVPATVVLLIDQSFSMARRFGRSTRWEVLRDAVVDPDDGLLQWLDQSARVGLLLYTSLNGFEGPGCPMLTRVEALVGNADRIRAAYLAESPMRNGDTPTGDAIDAAVRYINGLGAQGPRYILLLTDGDPDTCLQPDPQDGLEAATDAARRAFDSGVRVHTVGVSRAIDEESVRQLANAGAGKPVDLVFGRDDGAQELLFASTDPRQLARQLRGIIGDVRACTVDLGTDVGEQRVGEGRFSLDGQSLEYGAADGWTFIDADTVEIHGRSCDQILGDGERLEVTFPCVSSFENPR